MGLFGFGKPNIAKLKNAQDIDGLIKALGKKCDEDTQKKAFEALKEIGAPATDALIAALKDSDFSVRFNAVQLLGMMKITRAVEPICALLKDPDVTVRFMAASALNVIGDPRAIGPLTQASNDPSRSVREAVTEALGKLKKSP